MTPIVFLDTETTGLAHDRRPWDIGMIRREPDGTQREITLFISDVNLSGAELIGLRIGHFYDRHPLYRAANGGAFDPEQDDAHHLDPWHVRKMLADGECLVSEPRAAEIVERWTRGAHVVGSVPNFDTECLAAMLQRHGLCPAWHYHLADVETLALGWLAARGRVLLPPWKSEDISREIGVEPPADAERHTALGDAKWVARIWDRIMVGDEAQR